MVSSPPGGMQRIIPYLYYEDGPAALDFLRRAFGLEERFRVPLPGGGIGHAEVCCGDSVLMLASIVPDMDMASPGKLGQRHSSVLVYVDDVDAHHEQAVAAGARIVSPPEDKPYGDRMYTAADPEEHHWHFATHVRDVPPDEAHPGG